MVEPDIQPGTYLVLSVVCMWKFVDAKVSLVHTKVANVLDSSCHHF